MQINALVLLLQLHAPYSLKWDKPRHFGNLLFALPDQWKNLIKAENGIENICLYWNLQFCNSTLLLVRSSPNILVYAPLINEIMSNSWEKLTTNSFYTLCLGSKLMHACSSYWQYFITLFNYGHYYLVLFYETSLPCLESSTITCYHSFQLSFHEIIHL